MNRLTEQDTAFANGESPAQPSSATRAAPGPLVPVDPERYALEMRIEQAKGRIVEDLNRASTRIREVASRAGRGLGTVVVISGVLIAGVVVTALLRRNRRRVRITWR